MGAEIKSAFLTMLHVTPGYILVVSNLNPAEMVVDEFEMILQLRGYISAKYSSRELLQRFRRQKKLASTKVTGRRGRILF